MFPIVIGRFCLCLILIVCYYEAVSPLIPGCASALLSARSMVCTLISAQALHRRNHRCHFLLLTLGVATLALGAATCLVRFALSPPQMKRGNRRNPPPSRRFCLSGCPATGNTPARGYLCSAISGYTSIILHFSLDRRKDLVKVLTPENNCAIVEA